MRSDYAAAERYFIRMGEIYRQIYGEKHYLVAIARSNLATVYLNKKEYDRAEPAFRNVIELFTATEGPEHLNTGIAHIKLGRVLTRTGRYREAESQILTGYAIVAKQSDTHVSWLRNARKDLVIVYDSLHDAGKAAKYRADVVADSVAVLKK
jgi:tetratricopeptide (TPR) repeat protein